MNKVKKPFFVGIYLIAFGFCTLPNTPVIKNVAYDEPQQQILENEDLIQIFEDGECSLPITEKETLDIDKNLTDYDSGDYGDY